MKRLNFNILQPCLSDVECLLGKFLCQRKISAGFGWVSRTSGICRSNCIKTTSQKTKINGIQTQQCSILLAFSSPLIRRWFKVMSNDVEPCQSDSRYFNVDSWTGIYRSNCTKTTIRKQKTNNIHTQQFSMLPACLSDLIEDDLKWCQTM